jgi:hypothetical protein
MKSVLSIAIGSALLVTRLAIADASYQETTQITGGSLVDSLKSSPFLRLGGSSAKKLFDPVNKLMLVHGNQFAIISASGTEIIDIDQETTTHIDTEKKTYWVTTFDEMRQAFKDAPKKLEQAQTQMQQAQQQAPAGQSTQAPQLQITFDVSTKDTGETKQVNGEMCKEQVFTIQAHITDPNADPSKGPATMTYNYVTDIWTTPDPPEVQAVHDFYMRYTKKLMQGVDVAAMMKGLKPVISGSSLAPMFGSNPGLGQAMQEMAKKMEVEQAKIKGTRVMEITQLGGDAPAGTTATPNADGSTPNQAVTQAATDTAASQAGSRFGSLGSLLTRSVAGVVGRNSKPASPPAAPAAAAPTSVVMYETTTQKSQFSQEAIPPDAFQVPSGFKKVASPIQQMAAAAK